MPREIATWLTEVDGRHCVIAEHRARGLWVRNIQADPRGRVRVEEASVAAAARVVGPAAEPDLHAAVQGRPGAKYGWGAGPIVERVPLADEKLQSLRTRRTVILSLA